MLLRRVWLHSLLGIWDRATISRSGEHGLWWWCERRKASWKFCTSCFSAYSFLLLSSCIHFLHLFLLAWFSSQPSRPARLALFSHSIPRTMFHFFLLNTPTSSFISIVRRTSEHLGLAILLEDDIPFCLYSISYILLPMIIRPYASSISYYYSTYLINVSVYWCIRTTPNLIRCCSRPMRVVNMCRYFLRRAGFIFPSSYYLTA